MFCCLLQTLAAEMNFYVSVDSDYIVRVLRGQFLVERKTFLD